MEGVFLTNKAYQIQIFDTDPYIYAGNVRVRFYHDVSGNTSHDLYIDSVALYVNNIV